MIEIVPNAASMRLLEQAMKAADKKTTMTAQQSGRKAAYFICRSLGAAVKPKSLAKKRDVVPNPHRTGRGRKARGAKYAIKVLRQQGQPAYLPTNKKSDPRRKIRLLGLASSSFRMIAGKFGRRVSGKRTRGAKKQGYGVWRTARSSFQATIVSFLSYIDTAFPGAVDKAIRKGLTSFIRTFDRDWASALKEGR
jgi:hypothetical protein